MKESAVILGLNRRFKWKEEGLEDSWEIETLSFILALAKYWRLA